MNWDAERDMAEDVRENKELYEALADADDTTPEMPCLHEELERQQPANHRDGVQMLACPCPKCSPRC